MAHPNIIIITADGLRWNAMGCAGNVHINTPNIDALAVHGLPFTGAITPFPDRPAGGHAFLTGQVPEQPFDPVALPAEKPTDEFLLPKRLAEAGYTNAAVGALDFQGAASDLPFGRIEATNCEGLEDHYVAWLKKAGKQAPPGNLGSSDVRSFPLGETYHPTTWAGNRAVRVCQNAREPFFLWVSFPRPRPVFDPPAPWNRMYVPGQLQQLSPPATADGLSRRSLAAYYGCISQVDRQIGRILATLTARGHTNNLIVLTAGRGMAPDQPDGEATPTRDFSEALMRVPLIIAGHARQRKAGQEPALLALGDLVPTLLEVLSLPRAETGAGRSFCPLLFGTGGNHRQSVLSISDDGACLRTTRYKWIVSGLGEDSIIDLQADPLELHNLDSGQPSMAVRKMLMGLSQRDVRPTP